MNVLDLFSGIGGISLGLERAGMRTVAFCEIDPYCRRVLRRHWPDVPVYGDIRELTGAAFANASGQPSGQQYSRAQEGGDVQGPLPWVDVICGGFPCQDISVAGKGAGIGGERSGLWSEYARIIGEVRPRYVIVENVAALLGRGLARVLGDLAALGFDAEWHCIPASAVGAPHRRDRLWIVAYPDQRRCKPCDAEGWRLPVADPRGDVANATSDGWIAWGSGHTPQVPGRGEPDRGGCSPDVAHPHQPRLERWISESLRQCASEWAVGEDGSHSYTDSEPQEWPTKSWGERGHWRAEPDVGRVAHGVPSRVDRLRALGNAVVPQIPEIIGRAIMSLE